MRANKRDQHTVHSFPLILYGYSGVSVFVFMLGACVCVRESMSNAKTDVSSNGMIVWVLRFKYTQGDDFL